MRILVMSETGYGLGFIPNLTREGHSVQTIIGETTTSVATPDVAIIDTPKFTAQSVTLRSQGVKVIGVSQWSTLLEQDNDYKRSFINAIGYKVYDPALKPESSIETNVVCWFNGQRFISKSLAFNYPKFLAGDVGVDVDSAGFVVYFNVDRHVITHRILMPLEKFLRKANHRGCFSIDVVATPSDLYVKDVSSAITKPYTLAIYENSWRPKSDIMLDMFDETSKEVPHIDSCVCGVLLSAYPYPYSEVCPQMVINGLNVHNTKHMWLMDAFQEDRKWTSGNINGCIGYVLARGNSIEEARRRTYRTIKNIDTKNMQYRIDIGKDVNGKMRSLREYGYLS